jgi:hypothetical protein
MKMARYRTQTPDIVDSVKEIEKRLSILERTPQLANASIDARGLSIREGSIDVIDNDGNTRIRIGKLDDGSYDITAYSVIGNQTVNLAALAFGQKAAFETGNSVRSTGGLPGTYTDPDSGPLGPEVTGVLVGSSGRCKVTISAQMQATPTGADAGKLAMSFDVNGPTTIAASNEMAMVVYHAIQNVTDQIDYHDYIFRGSYVHYLDNLIPGTYSFRMKYFGSSIGGNTNYADRLLLVEPF